MGFWLHLSTSPLPLPLPQAWSARIGLSPIQLMMPLSFSAIIGGCVTIIGAPVNLLIISLAKDNDPLAVRVTLPFDLAVVLCGAN